MNFLDERIADRFWSKCAPEPTSGCWLWTASVSESGYGKFSVGRRNWRAHRYAFEALVGPVPTGLVLDHKCRVRCCVNPAHLEPVTNRENTRRGLGPAADASRRSHCLKGHLLEPGKTQRVCRRCQNDRAMAWSKRNRGRVNEKRRERYRNQKDGHGRH